MWNKIICLFIGHKKYDPNILGGNDVLRISDALGSELVSINVCERCGAVYSNLKR